MKRKVYLIKPISKFQVIEFILEKLHKSLSREDDLFCGKIHEKWPLVKCYSAKPKNKTGDFFYCSSTFGLNDKSYELIGPNLAKYGQLLPIEIEDIGKRHIYNITQKVNCFDFENSIYNIVVYRNPNDAYDSKSEEMSGKEAISRGIDAQKINRVYGGDWNSILITDKIDSPIFYTMDRDNFMGPYCTSGFFPEEEEFYHLYHKHGLTGLEFVEVKLS